jgi:integrase/recombinase XerD
MNTVRWECYPLVARFQTAQTWLQMQAHLQLSPKTIDAYGRCLNDFLAFCERHEIVPPMITREQVALYVQDLATRPPRDTQRG